MNARKLVRYLVVFICVFSVTFTLQAEDNTYVPPSHPIPIANNSEVKESEPSIAYDPERQQFLVAYHYIPENAYEIGAACVNKEGAVIATYALGNGMYPETVYDPSNDRYIVVWENRSINSIQANFVLGSCCQDPQCSDVAFTISGDRSGIELNPDIAYNTNENHQDFLIVWYEDEGFADHWGVWGRRMDGIVLKGPSFAISSPTNSFNHSPDVAYNLNMNEFMVVFTRDPSKGTDSSAGDIYGVRLFNGTGSEGGIVPGSEKAIDSSTEKQDYPQVAAYRINHDAPYLVVYRDNWNDPAGDVRGRFLNKQGDSVLGIAIATQPGIPEAAPRIHSNEARGGYAVVWDEYTSSGAADVYWRKISHNGDIGTKAIVIDDSLYNCFGDIVNSFPFPFAVWTNYEVNDQDVFGRFLYQETFLPSVLRNP